MLLAAKDEELFHNDKNSEMAYKLIKANAPAHLGYLPGQSLPLFFFFFLLFFFLVSFLLSSSPSPGKHYDAYNKPAYAIGVEKALHWFKLYLADEAPTSKL